MTRPLVAFIFCISISSSLHAENGWETLERLALKNNKKTINGEMLHNYKAFQVEEARLELHLPEYIQLTDKEGTLLVRIESDRIDTGQPKAHPTLAKAWNIFLDIKRDIASITTKETKDFFKAYQDSDYFIVSSFYDNPFQGIDITSNDKSLPFEKINLYFDSKESLQSIRVNFKNGLYGSFTVQP